MSPVQFCKRSAVVITDVGKNWLTDPKPTRWRPTGAPLILHVLYITANRGSLVVVDLTSDAVNLSSMD